MEVQALIQSIRAVSHFRDLPEADLKAIVTAGQILRFAPGATIFAEGETCSGLFVLLSGQVLLRKLGPRGQETIIHEIRPVIMFNEVAALDGGANPTSATACQECLTWQISAERFQVLVQRYAQIGLGLLQIMAARNRLLMAHVEDRTYRSVSARTAKLLLDISEGGKRPIDRRQYSNCELAGRVGTVPEALSRALRCLKQQGLISVSRTTLEVIHPEGLNLQAEVFPNSYSTRR